jgi:amidase
MLEPMQGQAQRSTDDLHNLSLLEISGRIRRRQITAAGVTQRLLERLARPDPTLHSFIMELPEGALAEARRADREIAAGRQVTEFHLRRPPL